MQIVIYILLILLCIFIILAIVSHFSIDVTNYKIKDKKIDKDMKVILLSDLHNRNLNDKLIKIIKNEKPDLIIMSGDMINERLKYTHNFIKLCDKLQKYNIYYTYGNHEEYLRDLDRIEYDEIISTKNIIVLNDKSISLTKNIKLYGIKLESEYYDIFNRKEVNKEEINDRLGLINEDKYNILIAHNPLDAKEYSKYGFDLTLSGHVHGGLIILPFIGPVLAPEFKFFPKYSRGIYEINKMKLLVSRGLGYSRKIPVRVLNNPEVVVINLMKE